MDSQALQLVFQMIFSAIIVPLVDWIQARVLPLDFPIRQVAFVSILAFGSAWLLAQVFAPTATLEQITLYALGSQVLAQYIDATNQTVKEIKQLG